MKKHDNYESAKIEIIYIAGNDVISTSTPTGSDNIGSSEGRFDQDAWA